MVLSDVDIERLIDEGKLIIQPFDKKNLRPVGIRIHLGAEILVPKPGQTIDLTEVGAVAYDKIMIPENGYTLHPGDFILGSTLEHYQFPKDLVGWLDGRSTYARLGLGVHSTACIIDGNFNIPHVTVLELSNIGPFNLIIKPGMHIGMVAFVQLSSEVGDPDNFIYQGQTGILPPNPQG